MSDLKANDQKSDSVNNFSAGDANTWPHEVIAYTDGASRGNPGPASLGIYVTDREANLIEEYGEKLGNQTNNFAEYTAVLRALQLASKRGARRIHLKSDSELMVKQMTGVYKVKSPVIMPLVLECKTWIKKFDSVTFEHVRREYNKEADRLANEALDRR